VNEPWVDSSLNDECLQGEMIRALIWERGRRAEEEPRKEIVDIPALDGGPCAFFSRDVDRCDGFAGFDL
jgi:hypothetical protein